MMRPTPSTAQFLASFALRRETAAEHEVLLDGSRGPRKATVYLPANTRLDAPCWVLLHGVTVPGRHHAALRRMAHALAAANHVAIAPQIPSWQGLDVRPEEAVVAVEDVLTSLVRWPVDQTRVGVLGFSVAATWGLEVAAAECHGRLAAAVSVGGYADVHRTIRAMVVGEHDWQGRTHRYAPDPYGRWIMGSSLLPLLEGDEWGSPGERQEAARALRDLALAAGGKGLSADLPVYDGLIHDLGERLSPGARRVWSLLAPPSRRVIGELEPARALASAMADAGVRAGPMLEPRESLRHLDMPVTLLHGRGDRLVPWSETLRIAEELSGHAEPNVTITRLLGHTKRAEAALPWNPIGLGQEVRGFVRFVDAMLSSVEDVP